METTAEFCPHCGTNQMSGNVNRKSSTAILTILCVVTFIGSLFTILRAFIYLLIAIDEEWILMGIRGTLYLLTSIGTIVGAAQMLSKRLSGLHIYSVSQSIYLLTVLSALGYYIEEIGDFLGSGFAVVVAMFFFLPSVAFLWLYWTPTVKQHLR